MQLSRRRQPQTSDRVRWSLRRGGLAPGRAALLSLAAAAAALSGCHRGPASSGAASPPTVLVAPVVQRDVPIRREWIAQLNGSVNAQISPKVSGYVVKRNYREGFFVTAGDVLFEIDPRPSAAALDQAKANVAQARANLGNSRLNVARDTPLAKERAIAQSQLDNDIQTLAANQAAVDSALAQQRTAELNLDWCKVRSPIDGLAGVATAQVGDLVGTTSTLTTVSRLNPIRAYFSVSESDYLSIAPRLSAVVRGRADGRSLDSADAEFIQANGRPFGPKGRFVLLGREVNSATGTIQFAAEFDNTDAILRPGGFGRVRLLIGTRSGALLVPQRAINQIQGQYQIVVVSPDHRAQFRNIEVAERIGEDWIVTQGIQAGESVVVEGFMKLRNGTPVHAENYVAAQAKAD